MTGPGPAMARHPRTPVVVELIGLSAVQRQLHWRITSAPLPGNQDPDGLARRLAGVQTSAARGLVLHSTSWRYTHAHLTVTYALFPDCPADPGHPLDLHLVTGPGPLQPSPATVAPGHVAAHAARHLADLAADRDPHITLCARQRPQEWHVLCQHARRVHVDHQSPSATPPTPVRLWTTDSPAAYQRRSIRIAIRRP